MLLTTLLVRVQNDFLPEQTLQDALNLGPILKKTLKNNYWGVDLGNTVVSESGNHDNRLSSSHWSIRQALHHCSLIRHGSHYKAYLHGALLCLEQYYQFCIGGNAVAQVQELKSQYVSECMQFRFSETTTSQNARIWDIHVPLGFHINLTVINLQMNYHPHAQCLEIPVKDGRYTGQGLAIDNYATVCQRSKQNSFLLPVSKARIILNYTRIPDCPVLEFLYMAITKKEPMKSYLTVFQSHFLNVFRFYLFQKTKVRLITHFKAYVMFAISLVNVTLRCENNFNRGNKLNFIDGPIFLSASYRQTRALIASLDCETLASNVTNSSLKGNNGQYLYLNQVKASIGDITAVLEGPDIDISTLDFSFRTDTPDTPYGNINVIDYTTAEPATSESLTANLPVQGRHFHVLYWLQRRSGPFEYNPRLVFRIKEFDMVSFSDGCHTGGIFIIEGHRIIASFCSQAGITFLNSTSETGGILFGVNPLVLILKGYSWFANIKLNISILYDNCIGVTNICEKFRDNWRKFPNKCPGFAHDVLCRMMTPRPCIEIVRLPSDVVFDYSRKCTILSHINRSPAIGYIQFTDTLDLTFAVKGHLDLPEHFPVIYPEYINDLVGTYFGVFPRGEHARLELNKKYRVHSKGLIINIKNTYPWLGIGHWIRLTQRPACPKEAVNLQPLEPLHISHGCGAVVMTSVTGNANIYIPWLVFKRSSHFLKYYQCLHVSIHGVSNGVTGGFFNAILQSFASGLHKHIVYTKRQHLELFFFSRYTAQGFSIELEWSSSLDRLEFFYSRRPEQIADKKGFVWDYSFKASWIRVNQPEVDMCSTETSSCYRYHQSRDMKSDPTWSMAQARCAEQNSSLVSINSPEEWRLLLDWAYTYNDSFVVGAFGAFNGRLLFIGPRRMDVSNRVGFLFLDADKNCAQITKERQIV